MGHRKHARPKEDKRKDALLRSQSLDQSSPVQSSPNAHLRYSQTDIVGLQHHLSYHTYRNLH
jgi:hypothetical protein